MPVLKRGDAEIYYEEFGSGFPVLAFAPGALRSQIAYWQRSPSKPDQLPPWMDPTKDLADRFRVIAVDQRNAGRSKAPLKMTDDWHTYADDQIALLDHLKIDRCHTLGGCIGASFCLTLCERVPERIATAGLLQPIGRVPEKSSLIREEFVDIWAPAMLKANPDLDREVLSGFGERMFGRDFVYSVSREFVAGCQVPMLVMPGTDVAHPLAIAEDIVRLAPRSEYVRQWKGEARAYGSRCVHDFFIRNTPQ